MKNIAIIIDSLTGGGAEKVMLTLAQAMIEQGHRVSFFVLKAEVEHDVPTGADVNFPFEDTKGRIRGWFNARKLATRLRQCIATVANKHGSFDLTLVNLYESYRLASLCKFECCYYVIHNSFEKELEREKLMGPIKYWYMLNIIKAMQDKNLIAVSKGVAQELKQSSLYKPQSVTVIYNPFNLSRIRQLASEFCPNKPSAPYLIHVGRAAKAKRHDVLFNALLFLEPDIQLVCLSGNVKKLHKLATKIGVQDRVIFPGFTTNPYPWIKGASVLVLSSDFEGLPTVLIEAIACNTKVVSTNCKHGPSEILLDELSQFLVEPDNAEHLAKAIRRALVSEITLANASILKKTSAHDVALAYLALIPRQ